MQARTHRDCSMSRPLRPGGGKESRRKRKMGEKRKKSKRRQGKKRKARTGTGTGGAEQKQIKTLH